MTKRSHYSVTCPACHAAPLSLIVTTGSDQGGWEDVEIAADEPRACGCEPDDDALAAAVERCRTEAA